MTMKALSRVLIFLIIFLNIANISSAIQVSSQTLALNICQCSQKTDSFIVTNDGLYSAIFTVSSNQDFVTLSNTKFELMPGQSQKISLLIKSTCDMKGEYPLEILVKSNLGEEKRFVKTLNIGKCQNLKADLFVVNESVEPCTPVNYTIRLQNTGPFEETYEIKAETYEEYTNISKQTVTLDTQSTELLNANLDLPCSIYGPQTITFSITAKNNKLRANLNHDLQIKQYYGYSLGLEESYNVCEEEPTSIPVKIINDVKTPNKYFLELFGQPSFVKLDTDKIELGAFETNTFNITLSPREGRNLGNYSFKLKTRAEYGDTYNDANITLFIKDCYKPKIKLSGPDNVCSGKQEYTVNVKNKGVYKEEIKLETIDGFAELEKSKITITSGEERNITLTINTQDINKKYALWVTAALNNNLTVRDEKIINVQTQAKCHFVDIDKTSFGLRAEKENKTTFRVTNKGLTPETYELLLQPHFWIRLTQTKVFLEPGETKELTLLSEHTSETEFGKYNINLTIYLTDEASYVKELTIKLKDKAIQEKAYIYFSKNPCQLTTLILGLAFIVLLLLVIFLKTKRGRIKVKPVIKSLAILIILSAIAVTLTYNYKGMPQIYPEINTSEASPVHHVWGEDITYQINLSKYFQDPDKDTLTFTVSEAENIITEIKNGTLTLTPDKDWYGKRTINFTATDTRGASATSVPITLEVVDVEELTPSLIYERLCWYINLVLLLISFLLIFLLVIKKAKKQTRLLKKITKKKKKKRG